MRVRLVTLLPVALSVIGLSAVVVEHATAGPPSAASFTAVAPTRLLDTRNGTGAPALPVVSKQTLTLALPAATVPPNASSVVLNLTVTRPATYGYITAYPGSSATRPLASNLNFVAHQTVPNLVTVDVSAGRTVKLYNGSNGPVDLVADVFGYFAPDASLPQGGFVSMTPSRLFDTRLATSTRPAGPVSRYASLTVTVAGGNTAIPATAAAVVLNLTETDAMKSGYLSTYPSGDSRPGASTLNFPAGRTVGNLVIVPVGADGQVTIYNGSGGTTDLLADVQGYLTEGDPITAGGVGALSPKRILDTRDDTAVAARGVATLNVLGLGGVPKTHLGAVVLNVTVTGAISSGYLTVYGGKGTRPLASNLNFVAGQTRANLVVAEPDSTGDITVYNGSAGTAQVLVDVAGYVQGVDLTKPATTASRYVSDLSTISDASDAGEACTDGASAAKLVLLQLGTQSVTSPLSPQNPGVALARAQPVTLVTYANLDAAVQSYVTNFGRCLPSGATARIALGTNTSGSFSGTNGYPAAQRGTDWAQDVINQISVPTGVTIVGADDIEASFAGSETDAETWETDYLAATAAALVDVGSADNCPDRYQTSVDCSAVKDETSRSKTWTRAEYVRLGYGLAPGRITVLPQIYFGTSPNQAVQWLNIDSTSSYKLTFEGSLTQYGICGDQCGYTPSAGWAGLYHALSTVLLNPRLYVASDLQPQ